MMSLLRRGRWRQLQDAMWVLVAIATVSMVITLHLSHSLTWLGAMTSYVKDSTMSPANELSASHLSSQRAVTGEERSILPHTRRKISEEDTSTSVRGQSPHKQKEKIISQFERAAPNESSNNEDKEKEKEKEKKRIHLQNGRKETGTISPSGHMVLTADISHRKWEKSEAEISASLLPPHNRKRIGLYSDAGGFKKSLFGVAEKETKRGEEETRGAGLLWRADGKESSRSERGPVGGSKDGGGNSRDDGSSGKLTGRQDLYVRLRQLEANTLPPDTGPVQVLTEGPVTAVKHHLPLIEAAFHKLKARVEYSATFDVAEHNTMEATTAVSDDPGGWSVLMCLNTTQPRDACIVSSKKAIGLGYRKVNVIPELQDIVLSPALLCRPPELPERHSDNGSKKSAKSWCGGELPCITSPSPAELKDYGRPGCRDVMGLWTVVKNESGAVWMYQGCEGGAAVDVDVGQRASESVVIPLPRDLLSIDNVSPLVWQMDILVTSLQPTRMYLHPDVIVWDSIMAFVFRKHQRNMSFQELHQMLGDLGSNLSLTTLLTRLKVVFLQFMKLITTLADTGTLFDRSCPRCFQLLESVVAFNSSFHPVLLQVTPSPYSSKLNSLSGYLLEQNVLEDLSAMLVTRETTARDVLTVLQASNIVHPYNGDICSQDKRVCLSDRDLVYLLDTRREQRSTRNWRRLFPSVLSTCAETGLKELQNLSLSPVEQLAVAMERSFLCKASTFSDFNIPKIPDGPNTEDEAISGNLHNRHDVQTLDSAKGCDSDPTSLPYLSAIEISPFLELQPEFSPLTTEYEAFTDKHILMVRIRAKSKHCDTISWLDNTVDSGQWTNFTLGLGANVAHIQVVEKAQPEPWVLTTYKLTIHRTEGHGRGTGTRRRDLGGMETCAVQQHCSLPYVRDSPCGLRPVKPVPIWSQYLTDLSSLPVCGDETVSGQWYVPCSSCRDNSTCLWKHAVWQTQGCREEQLTTQDVQTCLTGKKALFIGDSTNRGILHYIMERVNGSLLHWDKTHKIKVYPHLNAGRTVFGFAYYPQFWLPSRERPVFDKALHQLISRMQDLSNSSDTVVVLGGVHWLARHHIDVLVTALKREGLSGVRVIVKGLGAGFHQPVAGIHQLSVREQQRLLHQNQAALSYAKSSGFIPVDTFNMTMARFTDFLPGKCACHFHKMSPERQNLTEMFSYLSGEHSRRYHVEGDINAAYSEMVINRICR